MKAAVLLAILHVLGPRGRSPAAQQHADELAAIIVEEAARADVDPMLVAAIIARESRFTVRARSRGGDYGLMQVRRSGAARRHRHLTDAQLMQPRRNIRLGVEHLALVRSMCGPDTATVLDAYASGHCTRRRLGYSRRVLITYQELQLAVRDPRSGADNETSSQRIWRHPEPTCPIEPGGTRRGGAVEHPPACRAAARP